MPKNTHISLSVFNEEKPISTASRRHKPIESY